MRAAGRGACPSPGAVFRALAENRDGGAQPSRLLFGAPRAERLGQRLKHVASFPGRAVAEALRMTGASLRDVDYVAIGNDSNANIPAKVKHVLKSPRGACQFCWLAVKFGCDA